MSKKGLKRIAAVALVETVDSILRNQISAPALVDSIPARPGRCAPRSAFVTHESRVYIEGSTPVVPSYFKYFLNQSSVRDQASLADASS